MAKQSNQKLKLLYLLKILLEQTDAQSGKTLSEISLELAKYNISAGRKSLYDDIEALRVFGIDICVKRDRYVKYYIDKREFSFVELKYTIDALATFDAIDPEIARELIEKIVLVWGVKGRGYTNNELSTVMKMPRAISDELNKNIELINLSINNNKKITCKEFCWNSKKQRTLKNEGKPMVLTPIRLICDKKYILYAFDGVGVSEYRVDRLIALEILSQRGAPKSAYETFFDESLFDFDCVNVRIEFDSSYAGVVFDKFGLGVTVLSNREDVFEFSVKTKLDDSFYFWLFSNSKHIRKISSERVRDEYKERLLTALEFMDD